MSRIAIVLVLLAGPAAAGELVVRLKNGTDPAKGVAGAEVSVLMPVPNPGPGEKPRQTVTRKIESGDAVVFEFDDGLAGQTVNIMASYQEGKYFFTHGAKLGAKEAGPFDVFESTRDPKAMMIVRYIVQVVVAEGSVGVLEGIRVFNRTQQAYVGTELPGVDGLTTLILEPPPGAEDFEVTPSGWFLSDRLKPHEGQFLSDVTIPPGDSIYQYSYRIPVEGDTVEFVRRMSAKTHSVSVYAPEDMGFTLEVPGLESRHDQDDQGRHLVVFEGAELEEGDEVSIRVLVGSAGGGPKKEPIAAGRAIAWGAAGALAAMLLGLAAFLRPVAGAGSAAGDAAVLRDVLIEEIARLDLALEKKEIDEGYHRKQRESLKKRLLDLG